MAERRVNFGTKWFQNGMTLLLPRMLKVLRTTGSWHGRVRRFVGGRWLLGGVDAVGGDFELGDAAEGEEEFDEVSGRLLGRLFDDVGYGVGDSGLKGDAAGV